jgi:predicted O-methyltransferase YrrM
VNHARAKAGGATVETAKESRYGRALSKRIAPVSEFQRWYAGKSFTTDWSTRNFKAWLEFIVPNDVRRVLEIGSWEGRSAIFFLEYCPDCRITCIDTFAGGREHNDMDQVASIEPRFDANLASYGDRIEKIKSRSTPALDRLMQEGRLYDLIFIDGSHERDDVAMDSFLSWRLLNENGLLIWDDYDWGRDLPNRERPKQAVDLFLAMHADELDVVHMASQLIARRRAFDGTRSPPLGLRSRRTPRNLLRFLLGRPIVDWRS